MEYPTYSDMDIKTVIERAGGPTKLAKAIGKSHSTVLGWTRVPAEHVPAVSAITGIPRHELRPGLWDAPAPAAEQAA